FSRGADFHFFCRRGNVFLSPKNEAVNKEKGGSETRLYNPWTVLIYGVQSKGFPRNTPFSSITTSAGDKVPSQLTSAKHRAQQGPVPRKVQLSSKTTSEGAKLLSAFKSPLAALQKVSKM
ncbi:MAG: hypothetical protein ACRECJ_02290, partial [Limisphaerales bacterium]